MAATTQIIGMAEITVTVATRAPDVAQLLGLDISRNTAKAVDIAQWKEFNRIVKSTCSKGNLIASTAWMSQDADKRRKVKDEVMRTLEIVMPELAKKLEEIGADKRDNIIDNRAYQFTRPGSHNKTPTSPEPSQSESESLALLQGAVAQPPRLPFYPARDLNDVSGADYK